MRPTSLCFLACVVLLFTGALQGGASGPPELIQPGVQINGDCTLNFVYDGLGVNEGRVFVGTAAHCLDAVGQSVSTDAHADFGRVAYMAADVSQATDFAFIEVHPRFLPFVSPEVKGHPNEPQGVVASTDTARGDLVRFSGYGVGFHLTEPTQERRMGVLDRHGEDEWRAYAAITFGDSGGPVLHASGNALGIVTSIHASYGTSAPFVGASGATIEGVLTHAAADGFPVAMRTV